MEKVVLGKRLREARLQKGYTQQSPAEKADIGEMYLSEIERGIKMPSKRGYIVRDGFFLRNGAEFNKIQFYKLEFIPCFSAHTVISKKEETLRTRVGSERFSVSVSRLRRWG